MPNVTLPAGTVVELYAATGIIPGTQLVVSGISDAIVRLSATETGLTSGNDYETVTGNQTAFNAPGDLEAWALCISGGGVNVKES